MDESESSDYEGGMVEIHGAKFPRFSIQARLHHAAEIEKEERKEKFQEQIANANRRYNDKMQSIKTGRLKALSAFGIAFGIEYGIDYVQSLLKPKDEELKEQQIIKIIKTSKLKDYDIVSTKYDNIINRLRDININVNKMTGKEDIKSALLLDEIRYGVIASHLKNIQKESESDMMVNLLKYFKIGSWCGLGTDIPQALMREKLEKPFQFNKIDSICKIHDLAYLNSKNKDDIMKADREMLINIIDTYTISGISKLELNVLREFTYKNAMNTLLSFFTNINVPKTIAQITAVKELFKSTRPGETMSFGKGISAYILLRDKLTAIFGFTAIAIKTISEMIYGDALVSYNSETIFDEKDIEKLINDFEQFENERLIEAGYELPEEETYEINEEYGIENEIEEEETYEINEGYGVENEIENI